MTVADQTDGHQARCLPHLLMLRLLARDEAEAPSPWLAMAEVARATDAILAEVESRAVRSGPRRGAARAPASS